VAPELTERADGERPQRGFRRNLVDLLYRLRTEADAPAEQAMAYGTGAFIGSLPVYGFHLPLCLVVGKLLGLNRIKAFLASNLNNPIVGPFLVTAEIQAGSLLRRGRLYDISLSQLRQVRLAECLGDLVLGSVVVGVVLGAAFALLAYLALRQNAHDRFRRLLVEGAAKRFLAAGYWQWERARGTLRLDPVYLELVSRGLLPGHGRLVDAGCGRGTLLALLGAYRDLELLEPRPGDWAPPPAASLQLVGLERRSRMAAVARKVVGDIATIRRAGPRSEELPACTAVVMIDLLHRLEPGEQADLLARVVQALEPGGVLILREPDASAGWRFALWSLGRRLRALLIRGADRRVSCRPVADWRELLEGLGLAVAVVPVQRGRRSARVLLRAARRG